MKTAKLCATVTADTMADLRTQRDQVVDADLVELRLDSMPRPERGRRAGWTKEAGHRDLPANL